jgi:hypothetical protein
MRNEFNPKSAFRNRQLGLIASRSCVTMGESSIGRSDPFGMLLQTNSYLVPREKRVEHGRLLGRFRQTLARLGCTHFEAYEQVGSNWSPTESTGRFVQIMRFRDRKHQLGVQAAERNDAAAQTLIREFCELINFSYQQQQGLFAVGFYTGAIPMSAKATEVSDSTPEDLTAPVAETAVPDQPYPTPEHQQRANSAQPRPAAGAIACPIPIKPHARSARHPKRPVTGANQLLSDDRRLTARR